MVIEPLPGANAADFFDNRAFPDGSPYAPCYCNCFHLTADEVCGGIQARADALGGGFDGMKGALRESAAELIGKGVLRGYMAYENGVVVGWCNANEQQNYIRTGSFDPFRQGEEDYYISPGERGKIKSTACFEIAPDCRGRGIAKALLQRVCEDAAAEGYAFAEAYAQEAENFSALDFTGPEAMYRKAGFEEVRRWGKTTVMRKKLQRFGYLDKGWDRYKKRCLYPRSQNNAG